ncbi:MAG: gamma-glutamyl-gamma-aminobutyrate hydrolase family protein, partial [Solirubrobacterales bacterium]
ARSADGTVEAAELAGDPWFVGVQWHPELLPGRPAGDALFAALVEQARR